MHSINAAIVTDVASSVVCVSVCWAHSCGVQKRRNRSRCRLRTDSHGPKEPCIRWGSISDESICSREE